MRSKIKTLKTTLLIIFILNLFCTNSYSESVKIISKIGNEIITNIDVDIESKYLAALNPDLKKLNDNDIKSISKESLIREKIKLNEIKKYFDYKNFNNEELINSIIKSFYLKLNIDNEENFIRYLQGNNLEFSDVKKKIKVEILWNQLIGKLYNNQIFIDQEKIKKEINQKKLNKKISTEYDLSEIVFNLKNNEKLDTKYEMIKKEIKMNGFKTAAIKYSISDTANFGGKLGKINKDELSKIISNTLEQIKINDLTSPIKIGSGYLILKVNNINKIENEIDENTLFNRLFNSERTRQFNQYSIIHYNKIKLNFEN